MSAVGAQRLRHHLHRVQRVSFCKVPDLLAARGAGRDHDGVGVIQKELAARSDIDGVIIDEAIQMHGATGISHWSPLGEMYQDVRHLRFADGPDEVHWMVVGRHELSMP